MEIYMCLVHDVVKKICFRLEQIFFIDVWFLNGLSVVRRPVVTFHVEGCARSVFIRARYVYSCTIRARSVLFVRDLFLRARSVFFVRDQGIFLRSSCAPCFCRSRVRTPGHATRSVYWSQVRFLPWLPISGQWDPWPTSKIATILSFQWTKEKETLCTCCVPFSFNE